MLITHRLQLDTPRPVALALGTFDGLHLGHRAVIDQVLQGDFIPAVLTFDGHPRQVLEHKQPPLLQTAADKYALLEEWGVKAVFSLDFASIRDLSPEDFLHMLCTRLPVGRLCCGFNFRFGRNGAGDADFLKAYGAEKGIEIKAVPPVEAGGLPISSSRIRNLLIEGKTEEAVSLLGHPFFFTLEVVGGDQRGRTIGFPTINQILPDGLLQPRFGVYASRTRINGRYYPSVTNVGLRPTFRADRALSETHIIGYAGDLYGRRLRVELLHFLRDETKFGSLEELKNAISRDLHHSLYYIYPGK